METLPQNQKTSPSGFISHKVRDGCQIRVISLCHQKETRIGFVNLRLQKCYALPREAVQEHDRLGEDCYDLLGTFQAGQERVLVSI